MSEGKVAIITAGGSGIGAASDRAAYITGQNIPIDGGITHHV